MTEPDIPDGCQRCTWCAGPVFSDSCVKVRDMLFHWDCFWEAGETLKENGPQSKQSADKPDLEND